MKVVYAESMGYCFGVRDALGIAEEVIRPEEVTIYGELVHNASVVDGLAARGFRQQLEVVRDVVPATERVLITAHGVSERERERLESRGKQLIDTTCPLVRRVHETAGRLAAEGRHVIVIGRAGHVEVRGVVGDLPSYCVVEDEDDVRTWRERRLGVVCQTTTPPELAERVIARIRERNPEADIEFVNTICQPTIDRQLAVERMLPEVDAVVVVGGKNSNNTMRLVELCRRGGVAAHHVQGAEDLRAEWFVGCERVGVTAGTSTPDTVIEGVGALLCSMVPAEADAKGRRSSEEWCRHFRRNERMRPAIDWERVRELTDEERAAVGRSVAVFQLGESGEGLHLLKCAGEHAESVGDPNYRVAAELFMREEGKHAEMLGRFLDAAGVPRIAQNWSDGVFRWLRHRAGLELTITVLVTAEILAKVYYAALREATGCGALVELCGQILRDEVAHVRFQCERMAILQRRDSRWLRRLKRRLHAVLFGGTTVVLWVTHRSVFRAAEMGFGGYWGRAWGEFERANPWGEVRECSAGRKATLLGRLCWWRG